MDKRTELNNALKEAMKAKDEITVATVRLINAGIKDRDINARGSGNTEGISDTEILSMMQSMIKQRQESAETYKGAGRQDLYDRETGEIAVIQRFMPKQMSEAEVDAAIGTLITELNVKDIKEMGKVMAELKARYAGQLDMTKASGAIKKRLAG
ncbi:MAG: GatB/YqeY domain-containing protein [Micavibrio aeruginosavorus]|uniref:GatB/YqeY domain-containing protein n=1 Tax=Micavibrio aeruginosavorus TaxID=349221 RepID=A0A7T5R4C2_9BACT|nr:MAG: GatB/YqeY domain-containing protein [Micavibrio aeruginosavorus]